MELQWPLIIFTLFVSLGAGIFGWLSLLAYKGKGKNLYVPAIVVTAICVAVGGIGSFLHLQHPERAFNGFGHITSGITHELIGIVIFSLVVLAVFVRVRKGGASAFSQSLAIAGIVASALLVVLVARSYMMPSRPVWDTLLLPIYYLANASVLGALGIWLIARIANGKKSADSIDDDVVPLISKGAFISLAFLAVTLLAYVGYIQMTGDTFVSVGYYSDPTDPSAAMIDTTASTFVSLLSGGPAAMYFWLGAVVIGLAMPVALLLLARKKDGSAVATAFLAAVVGSMCFRVVLYTLGSSVFLFY